MARHNRSLRLICSAVLVALLSFTVEVKATEVKPKLSFVEMKKASNQSYPNATQSINTASNPNPIGITLNKTTLDELKKVHRVTGSSANAVAGYSNNFLDTSHIQMPSLTEATVVTNKGNVAEAVMLTMNRDAFKDIHKALQEKYKTVSSRIPHVGDRKVVFDANDCTITLSSPHMNFSMYVVYATKNLMSIASDNEAKEKNKQDNKIKALL